MTPKPSPKVPGITQAARKRSRCACGAKATVFRPASSDAWCKTCSPFAYYEVLPDEVLFGKGKRP